MVVFATNGQIYWEMSAEFGYDCFNLKFTAKVF